MANVNRIAVNPETLVAILSGEEKSTQPVGYAWHSAQEGDDREFFTIFVATDRETQKVYKSKDGTRVNLNLRKQRNLGEMLPKEEAPKAEVSEEAVKAAAAMLAKELGIEL